MKHPFKKDGNELAHWLIGEHRASDFQEKGAKALTDDLNKIIQLADTLEVKAPNADALFNKINERIKVEKPVARLRTYAKWSLSGIAAIGIVLISLWFFNGDNTFKANYGEQFIHALPENSKVILNANSEIKYSNDFVNNRELFLKGEAFFEVEKGSFFQVKTEKGTVTVLGTSFNVNVRKNVFAVACKTGKVKVEYNEKFVILEPGMKTYLGMDEEIHETLTSFETIDAWTNGESRFSDSNINEVISSLAAWYNISVEINTNIDSEKFTGSFVHDDLDKALKMVFLPMGLTYDFKSQNQIVVSK